jgi:hypothetical protein
MDESGNIANNNFQKLKFQHVATNEFVPDTLHSHVLEIIYYT